MTRIEIAAMIYAAQLAPICPSGEILQYDLHSNNPDNATMKNIAIGALRAADVFLATVASTTPKDPLTDVPAMLHV